MPADLSQQRGWEKTSHRRTFWVRREKSDEYFRGDFDGEGEDGALVVAKS
jgi:hypothetical protein